MPKFVIPPSMAPGALRPYGFFKPGDILTTEPDEVISLSFIPIDAAAYAMQVKAFGEERVKAKHGDGPSPPPEPVQPVDDTMTFRQLNAKSPDLPHVTGKKGQPSKRAADK